ncbi:hypothetical protein ABIE26_003646 [Pedobacter africanus]|uniref:Uncharacterized protein n=1 Tax=Pedobacter africanus TaxID=151894 RepID=A0ACC6KZZ3_9SPHI|nr:hypothetical protein [Pedobacter africanus]MDR6784948.1 hypothetical protein [Pedobacter africanus]
MKKIFILCLIIAAAISSDAQTTPTIKKSNVQQITPVIALPTTISKTALSRLPKEKDLALSDLQIQKDIVTGLYTISCKITNVGTSSVFLKPIGYSKCDHEGHVTEQSAYIVHCKIEPENCKLSSCGVTNLLYVYKPDGNFFSSTTYSSDEDRTLKPGQSFIAKTLHPTSIFWGKPDACKTDKIEVMLSLDPINRLGDQSLSNNVLKAYFPVQK